MTNQEMKRKVMSLGNRLAVRMNRKDAFVQAWAIVRSSGFELPLKGVTFGSRQEALRRLAKYNAADVRAFIVPETSNVADNKAAAVFVGVQNGKGLFCMGYLPREYAPAAVSLKATGLRVIGDEVRGARLRLAV